MLSVVDKQKTSEAIKVGAAFRQAYYNVKKIKSFLWFITLLLALVQLLVAVTGNNTTNMTTMVISLLALYVLLGSYGKTVMNNRQALGCRIQCLHDFIVLGVGIKPNDFDLPQSQINKLEAKWVKKDADKKRKELATWWDSSLKEVSFSQARFICSFSTFSWELELRKKYHRLLILILCLSVVFPIIISIYFKFSIFQTIVLSIAPFTPFISLVTEELLGNLTCLKKAEKIRHNCKNIWDKIQSKTIKDEDLMSQIDSIMISWQNYRESTLPIFEWLYRLTRKTMEEDMIIDTQSIVKQIKDINK
ncbi:TPA: S-4TM family putative pore-forming effector [Photobacterium damselae]